MVDSVLLSRVYKALFFLTFVLLSILPLMAEQKSDNMQLLDANDPIPDAPIFSVEYKGAKLECSPVKLIEKKTHKDEIKYHCVENKMAVSENESAEAQDEGRGAAETARMRQSVQDKSLIYTVHIPQSDAENIRIARFIAEQQLNNRFYGKFIASFLPARLYASLRPQFANIGDSNGTTFQDGGSRGGFFYYYQFHSDIELTLQYEAGLNFNKDTPFINLSDGENSSRRLSYLSLTYGKTSILAGKYWSAYYDIAGFTDYFMAYGTQTSGAFNNATDGGASGTGRPDKTLQIRSDQDQYKVTLQLQPSHSEQENIDKEYQYGVAGSVIYKGWSDIKAGGSFVYQSFDEITPEMYAMGITGNDQSYIIGSTYKREKLGINAVLSYTKNHMNDDQGIYFDGVGAELYLRYDVDDSFRMVAGANVLIPRDSEYSGVYSIRTPIISLQYTFGKKTFDDLIYIEVSKPYGRLAGGDRPNTRVAIGLRWLWQR